MAVDFRAVTEAALQRHRADLITHRGQAVTYTPTVGSPYQIAAIVYTGEQALAKDPTAQAVLWAPFANFAASPVKNDVVTYESKDYFVSEVIHEPPEDDSRILILRYKRTP